MMAKSDFPTTRTSGNSPSSTSAHGCGPNTITRRLASYTMVYFDLETTGFGNRAEICQIGAYFSDTDFTRYVCPRCDFDTGAAEATGFSKKDGKLHLRGKQVQTVSILKAWTDFLEFLKYADRSVVLVIHNRPFDSRFLLRDLSSLKLIEHFRELCIGMIDTLPLVKEVFPERKKNGKNYKLEDLVRDLIGEEHTSGCHNAVVDVRNLEKIIKHSNVQAEILQKHYLSLSDLENSYDVRQKANFLKYRIPGLTSGMAKKISEAEITYRDLKCIYDNDGEDGIKGLLTGMKENGKPRVTRNKRVVEDITQALSGLKLSS